MEMVFFNSCHVTINSELKLSHGLQFFPVLNTKSVSYNLKLALAVLPYCIEEWLIMRVRIFAILFGYFTYFAIKISELNQGHNKTQQNIS